MPSNLDCHYQRICTVIEGQVPQMSSLIEPPFALQKAETRLTVLNKQNGDLYVYVIMYIIQFTYTLFMYTNSQASHSISQYCRQELWCRFHQGFWLSITVHILWLVYTVVQSVFYRFAGACTGVADPCNFKWILIRLF